MKSRLAEVRMTPLIDSSFAICSIASASSAWNSGVMTLTGLPGMSMVRGDAIGGQVETKGVAHAGVLDARVRRAR
jgi:hypothetical protein